MNPPTPPNVTRGGRGALQVAAVLALVVAVPPAIGVEVLTNNLDRPVDGIEKVSNLRWLGSQFTTDNKTYLLTDVTLKLQRNIPGTFEAAIYTDANGKPGQLVGLLDSKGQITGVPSNVLFKAGDSNTTQFSTTVQDVQLSGDFAAPKGVKVSQLPGGSFTASGAQPTGLTLAPNTTYWVVMRAKSGEFASAYTDQETGTGVGYSPTWAQSSNAGGSWLTQNTSPLFIGVTGDPTRIIVELRTDLEAIQSAVFSGLPTALAQREIVLSALSVSARDVNERLFRLRSGADVHRGWDFFVTGGYGAADTNTVLPTTGFQSDVWAGTVGGEYRFARHLTIGGAFTVLESDTSMGLGVGEVDVSGFAVSTYVSYQHGGFYADALYQFAKLDHDISRQTLFGETAHADPDSENHVVELNVGYNLEPGSHISTGPFASLTYTTGDIDGYTEHGGATKNVRVGSQNFDSLVSRVGWQFSMPFNLRGVTVTPQLRVAWRHEFLDESEPLSVALVQSPYQIGAGQNFQRVGSFAATSHTEAPNADALEVGFGTLFRFSNRFSFIIDYEARVFQGDGVLHSITLTGNLRF